MKICMMTNTFTPHVGGVARSVSSFTAEYRRRGHYEQCTHYVPSGVPRLKRSAIDLATGYCNLCDVVIAPSESVAELLRRRGVKVRVGVIPTGVDMARLESGDGLAFRWAEHIPARCGRIRSYAVLVQRRFSALAPTDRECLGNAARETADRFSIANCAELALKLYQSAIAAAPSPKIIEGSLWAITRRRIEMEWRILPNIATAVGNSFHDRKTEAEPLPPHRPRR